MKGKKGQVCINKQSIAYTTSSLIFNCQVSLNFIRLLAILEGIAMIFYALGFQKRVLKVQQSQALRQLSSSIQNIQNTTNSTKQQTYSQIKIDLTFYDYFTTQDSENDNLYQMILYGILVFLCALTLILLMLFINDGKEKVKKLSEQSLIRQIFGTFLIIFRQFLYLPTLHMIVRSFLSIDQSQAIGLKALDIGIKTLCILLYLLIATYCLKVFRLPYPSKQIPWSGPNSKQEFIPYISRIYIIVIFIIDINSGNTLIEIIPAIILSIMACFSNMVYLFYFNKSLKIIYQSFQFLTLIILCEGFISEIFADYQRQEPIYVIIFSIFLTISWISLEDMRDKNLLIKYKQGKMKLEIEYEKIMYQLIRLVEKSLYSQEEIYQVQIISLLEWHSENCFKADCICQNQDDYLFLLREGNYSQQTVFKVAQKYYDLAQNRFTTIRHKLINSIGLLSSEIRSDNIVQTQAQKEQEEEISQQLKKTDTKQKLTSLISQNDITLVIADKEQEKKYKVDISKIQESFQTQFIQTLIKEIQSKFPLSLRIESLCNYYSMYIMKRQEQTITEIRFFNMKNPSWVERNQSQISQLYLLREYEKRDEAMILKGQHIMVDGEFFIRLNQIYDKYNDTIEHLTTQTVDFWTGFSKEDLRISEQSHRADQIAISIKNLYKYLTKIETLKSQKDYKLYYWISLVQLYILNDEIGYRQYVAKMKEIVNMNRFVKKDTKSKYTHEDACIMISDAFQHHQGKIMYMNLMALKFLEYSQEEYKYLNIKRLMPDLISQQHDDFMTAYNNTGESVMMNKLIVQFMKKRNESIAPVEFLVKFHYSEKFGYTFISMFRPLVEIIPFEEDQYIQQKTESVIFMTVDSYKGQIFEASQNFPKLLNILGYSDVLLNKDLAFKDRPKFLNDILKDFNFEEYQKVQILKKEKLTFENIYTLDLSIFNENNNLYFEDGFDEEQNSQTQSIIPEINVRISIYDESYGSKGSVKMSVIVMQLIEKSSIQNIGSLDSNEELVFNLEETKNKSSQSEDESQSQSQSKGIDLGSKGNRNQNKSQSEDESQDSISSNDAYSGINDFHTYSQVKTPKNMKIIMQLLTFVFIVSVGISTFNLGYNMQRHSESLQELAIIRKAYERINLTAMNRMILRILLNIANDYEPNSNDLIEDRFTTYTKLQKERIEQLRSTQNFLDDATFKYSQDFKEFKDSKNVMLRYLNEKNQVFYQNQTMQIASSIFTGKLTLINGDYIFEQYKGNLSIMNLNPRLDFGYLPRIEEQNIFFTVVSGNDVMREFNWKYQLRYINETKQHSMDNIQKTKITVIISVITIVLVGLLVSPLISKTEERNFQKFQYFIKISQQQIFHFIQNATFCQNLYEPILSDVNRDENKPKKEMKNGEQDLDDTNHIHQESQIRLQSDTSHDYYFALGDDHLKQIKKNARKSSNKAYQILQNLKQENLLFDQNIGNQKTTAKEIEFLSANQEIMHISDMINEHEIIRSQNMKGIINNLIVQQNQDPSRSSSLKTGSKNQNTIQIEDVYNNNMKQIDKLTGRPSMLVSKPQVTETEEQQIRKNLNIVNKMAIKARFQSFFIVFIFMGFFSSYFVISYFMSDKTFTQSANAIDSLDIIYFKDACIENVISFIRESQIRNTSFLLSEDNKTVAFDKTLNNCYGKEASYLKLRKELPPYFEGARSYIELIEQEDVCQKVYTTNSSYLVDKCQNAMKGIMSKGISNALSYMYSFMGSQNLDFKASQKQFRRDYDFLYGQLSNADVIELIDTKEYVLYDLFQQLKDECEKSVQNYFKKLAGQYLAIYIVFIFVLIGALVVFLLFAYRRLRSNMWSTNLILKMIPREALNKRDQESLSKFFIS